VSEAALPPLFAWVLIHCITPKTIWVSSFDVSTRKLGKPQATTDTARKLSRIIYYLLRTKERYNDGVFHRCEADSLKRRGGQAPRQLLREAAGVE